jgi:hypothetical protein
MASLAIEATEFPDWATKYRVHAVPKTVVNESSHFEGCLRSSSWTKS